MTAAPAAPLNRLEFAGNLLARGARRTLNLIRSAPATFALIAIIAVTSYLLSQASPAEARHMLLARSTNLHQLTSLNLDVLMRSAFWLEDASELLPWAALFLFVLAPAERWLGTWRWLVVFVAGHIGATAAIGAAIWIAITAGLVSRHLAYSIDVGVSYGFFAVAAIAIYHIPARWRGLFLALLALLQLYGVSMATPSPPSATWWQWRSASRSIHWPGLELQLLAPGPGRLSHLSQELDSGRLQRRVGHCSEVAPAGDHHAFAVGDQLRERATPVAETVAAAHHNQHRHADFAQPCDIHRRLTLEDSSPGSAHRQAVGLGEVAEEPFE